MSVDISHLVFESLGNTNNEVVDQGLYRSEGCDVFASTMVEFDVDCIGIGS